MYDFETDEGGSEKKRRQISKTPSSNKKTAALKRAGKTNVVGREIFPRRISQEEAYGRGERSKQKEKAK